MIVQESYLSYIGSRKKIDLIIMIFLEQFFLNGSIDTFCKKKREFLVKTKPYNWKKPPLIITLKMQFELETLV